MSIRKSEINLFYANLLGLVIFGVAAGVFVPIFNWMWPDVSWLYSIGASANQLLKLIGIENLYLSNFAITAIVVGIASAIISMVAMSFLLVIPHELTHGITAMIVADAKRKDIKFGIMWKKLCTPYCHCNKSMQVRQYRLMALMPLYLLGVLPCLLSLFIGSPILLAYGIVGIVVASGDIWMTWLLRNEDANTRIYDHPSAAGFFLFDTDEDFEEIKKELNN